MASGSAAFIGPNEMAGSPAGFTREPLAAASLPGASGIGFAKYWCGETLPGAAETTVPGNVCMHCFLSIGLKHHFVMWALRHHKMWIRYLLKCSKMRPFFAKANTAVQKMALDNPSCRQHNRTYVREKGGDMMDRIYAAGDLKSYYAG